MDSGTSRSPKRSDSVSSGRPRVHDLTERLGKMSIGESSSSDTNQTDWSNLPNDQKRETYYHTMLKKLLELPLQSDKVLDTVHGFLMSKDKIVLNVVSDYYDNSKDYPHIRRDIIKAVSESKNIEAVRMIAKKFGNEGIYDNHESIIKAKSVLNYENYNLIFSDIFEVKNGYLEIRPKDQEDVRKIIIDAVCLSKDPEATVTLVQKSATEENVERCRIVPKAVSASRSIEALRILVQRINNEADYITRRYIADAAYALKDPEAAKILSQHYPNEESAWTKAAMQRAIEACGDPMKLFS